MSIERLLNNEMSLSFEVFPPKAERPVQPLLATLERLYQCSPDFISCTYGAGGTNKGRSAEICRAIAASGEADALAHLTCVGNSREGLSNELAEHMQSGVRGVLALRGDFPNGWEGPRGEFARAVELVEFMCKMSNSFAVGVACYPEKHLLAPSLCDDIDALYSKQQAGACFAITQLCYDVDAYSRFIEKARARGVNIPIAVGIMPAISRDGVIRMTLSNGCSIPSKLAAIVGRYENSPEDFKKAGKEYTAALIDRYLRQDIGGIHIYTLNNRDDAADVLALSSFRKRVK
ncbi:MAG: methylenetetrahydrofolate reductase [Oscillospiraceae bacterium]